MVDSSNLPQINALYAELKRNAQAIASFKAGEPIRMFQIGSVTILTENVIYPPGMADALRNELNKRQTIIKQELSNLGMTVSEEAPRQL